MPEIPMSAEFELRDPLHDVTRKERRFLLGLSLIAIVLIEAKAFPNKLSALGLEFSCSDHIIFMEWLRLLLVYATGVFFVYGIVDLISWRNHWNTRKVGLYQPISTVNQQVKYERVKWQPPKNFVAGIILRLTIDFLFPLCFGSYAIYVVSNIIQKGFP